MSEAALPTPAFKARPAPLLGGPVCVREIPHPLPATAVRALKELSFRIMCAREDRGADAEQNRIDELDKYVANLRETLGVDTVRPEYLMTAAPPAPPPTKTKAKAKK